MSELSLKSQMIKAREEYIEIIKSEILGPGSEISIPDKEHELISTSPKSRYSIGILFPQNSLMNQDNDEIIEVMESENEENEEELKEIILTSDGTEFNKGTKEKTYSADETANEGFDEDVELASQFKQSSMGITFIIAGNTELIKAKLKFATYRKALLEDCVIPYAGKNSKYIVPMELAHKMQYDDSIKALRLISPIDYKEARLIFEKDTIPEDEAVELKFITYRFIDILSGGYVREPHDIDNIIFDFTKGNYVECEQIEELKCHNVKITALKTPLANGTYSVTIMVVNVNNDYTAKSVNCLFQTHLEVNTTDNDFIFVDSSASSNVDEMDDEEKSLDLLYRNKKNYATGLGTSADWNIDKTGKGSVWNEYFPQAEVPSMDFSLPKGTDLIKDSELSMKYLSDLDKTDKNIKITSMQHLIDLYRLWVDDLKSEANTLSQRYKFAANSNIQECVDAYTRMYNGIEILKTNSSAYMAFELANRAMFMQRIHIKMQEKFAKEDSDRYPDDEEVSDRLINMNYYEEKDDQTRWRPFQLAFLLMDIASIVDDHGESKERDLVDLIWFPTGGGKTEAYLGLTAFTIFYRRMVHLDTSSGTAVMMRYTLRLLAAQQFTRASTLICACEYIRQDCSKRKSKYPSYNLGKTPITIGLWIGGTHIPNKNDGDKGAKFYLDKLTASRRDAIHYNKKRFNKFQVLKCPWCGTKLVMDYKDKKEHGAWGYAMENNKHFYMFCTQEDCDFSERLPIQIIDDELYDNPPTLLFGTVDKFAMLPWDGRISSFFGTSSDNRCPELIIQDELHLISGSLGTMVGLYETSIDALCSQKGIHPKIVASTATIRRAKEQCSVLYNREIVQFPAPGLNAEDSFFAKESEVDYEKEIYGRKYIGIQPSGKTKAMTEIRLMAALLQRLYNMPLSDQVKDKYWTLTAYYNNLKDLGKASTMVEDDVKDFIIRTANRLFERRRYILGADELTSRVSTTELNDTLDKLEKVEYSKENIENKKYASNILLATNMISVGIDVARLNVMLMVGQPKLTSEYIQASSRVGRSYPGMVIVQYDSTKSRDRSHYERFKAYHDSFYRYVEPTGATPFSKPARDRALHAVLTAILRNQAGLLDDKSAIYYDKIAFEDTIRDIEQYVIDRVKEINVRSNTDLDDESEEISYEMDEFFDFWQDMVDECNSGENKFPLYFGRKFMVKGPTDLERRLLKQYNGSDYDRARETMTSMRNVDTSVTGRVIVWED